MNPLGLMALSEGIESTSDGGHSPLTGTGLYLLVREKPGLSPILIIAHWLNGTLAESAIFRNVVVLFRMPVRLSSSNACQAVPT